MPNLKDIRKRIGSVKNTQKITRAMKLVAASKLRRAQEAIEAARPYAIKIREVVSVIAQSMEDEAHPLLQGSPVCNKSLILIITSDRGLCGAFNSGLMRATERFIRERKAEIGDAELMIIGKKGVSYFETRDVTIHARHPDVFAKGTNSLIAREFTATVIEKFASGEFDRVYLAYNEFFSAITQEQRIDQLLPISTDAFDETTQAPDFIFEPNSKSLLDDLLPRYVETMVLRAMLDSAASEQGSRMSAMDSATNNASDMISSLTLQYNRARQAAITRELVEITSGAEALHG